MRKTPKRIGNIFVASLPDLMTKEDYVAPGRNKKIRIRIKSTEEGLEILGDSRHPLELEKLLAEMGADEIERMLCG